MSGYFLDGSNDGGFTIQPCTFVLLLDVYQISSVCGTCLPASRSSLTFVSFVTAPGVLRLYLTTSCGWSGSVSVPAATRSFDAESSVSTCAPVVTGFAVPVAVEAK